MFLVSKMKKILPSVAVLFLLAASVVGAAGQPQVYFEPTPLILNNVGDSGRVEVKISGATNISGYEFRISFDYQAIRVDRVEVLNPPTGVSILPLGPEIDNGVGSIAVGALNYAGEDLLAGATTALIRISITTLRTGTTNLSFTDAILTDTNYRTVTVSTTDGRVQTGSIPTPTPTPTSTPIPTPTQLPTPTPTTIPPGQPSSLKLDLLKVWFQKQDKSLGRGHEGTVLFYLKRGGAVVLERVVRLDDNGEARNVELPGVGSGTYDALIYKSGYLTKKLANVEIREVGNNLDFTKRETEYFLVGDFNGDQVVNILDFSILIKNYNKRGEE